MPNYYIAKVIDNNDEDKQGKVKIYIDALMHGVKSQDDYLWAYPAQSGLGGSSEFGVSNIPNKDSLVWVFFDDEVLYKKAFYFWNVNISEINPHKLYEDNVKANINAESEYPEVKYIYSKSGICLALSEGDKPEITIYHPSASLFIDKDGDINIKNAHNDEMILNDEGINIKDANNNTIQMTSSGTIIKDKNNNETQMSSTGIVIKDSNGNEIQMAATGITITGGKSLTVTGSGIPSGSGCFLGVPNCIFSGAPIATNKINGI